VIDEPERLRSGGAAGRHRGRRLAGHGRGACGDRAACHVVEPNAAWVALYAELFETVHRRFYATTAPLHHALQRSTPPIRVERFVSMP